MNPAFTRMTGYAPEEVVGLNPSVLNSGRQSPAFYARMWDGLLGDGHWQGEVWNRRKDRRGVSAAAAHHRDPRPRGVLTRLRGAVHRHRAGSRETEARIRDLAYYDPLTGLPNRRLLDDRLQVELAHAAACAAGWR